MVVINVNGQEKEVDCDRDTPLLWVLREQLCLTGTKYGCGIAMCGACTVHLDGEAVRSCVVPVSSVGKRMVTTIEGLAGGSGLHPLQEAWVDLNVPQCGYCQPGQIMAAAALLDATHNDPSDDHIDSALSGNLCRCGTYPRIRRAIKKAAESLRATNA